MTKTTLDRALATTHRWKDHDFGDEWFERVEDRLNYDDLQQDPHWRNQWISFDGVTYCPRRRRVYCGITSFAADIFQVWDCETATFIDPGFDAVVDPYDAKFHRSMQLTEDGRHLYTATALLHDVDRFFDAPGGGVFRTDLETGRIEKLAIPIPHVYIQAIALDEKRGRVYSMHFTPEHLSVLDLDTLECRDLGPISSGMVMAQGENLAIDDAGGVWCGWHATRAWQWRSGVDSHRLCRVDPETLKIKFFKTGLPRADGERGFVRVEGLFNLGGGVLHASGGNGSLYRLDPETAKATYLGTPITDRPSRLTQLVKHADGYAYGVTGRAGRCVVIRFDPAAGTWALSGEIADETGATLWQAHDVTITPEGTLFAGENDHPRRSSYLWQIDDVPGLFA
jgi:hypothetical protein